VTNVMPPSRRTSSRKPALRFAAQAPAAYRAPYPGKFHKHFPSRELQRSKPRNGFGTNCTCHFGDRALASYHREDMTSSRPMLEPPNRSDDEQKHLHEELAKALMAVQ
jgi:hypothetical protein